MLNNQRVLADLNLTNTQHSWKEWVDMSRRRLECLSEDVAHPIRISYHHRPSLGASPISLDKSSSEARVFIGWIPGFISSHIEIATLADWTRHREIIILHNHHLKYRGPSCRNPASPFHPFCLMLWIGPVDVVALLVALLTLQLWRRRWVSHRFLSMFCVDHMKIEHGSFTSLS